jgi:transporter family-2 protein
MTSIYYALWAFAAGALIPLMATLNAGLARAAGGQVQATVILFAVGLLGLLLFAVATGARVPELHALARAAPRQYAGGLIVGCYVLSITFLAPRFGVGNAILFAVTAQLMTSALIDHFAFAGATLRPLTVLRVVGLLIVIAGVAITQLSDRLAALAK